MSKVKGVCEMRGRVSTGLTWDEVYFQQAIAPSWWFGALCRYLYRWQFVRA